MTFRTAGQPVADVRRPAHLVHMPSSSPSGITPWERRPARFVDVYTPRDWRLKRYRIHRDGVEQAWSAYDDVWPLVDAALPDPAVTPARPGVGFVIAHHGANVHYVVLGWWDNGNELPLRVWVRGFGPGATWRPASGNESVCVWDLQVIAFERDAYVETVMQQAGPDPDAYLTRQYGVG